jgi:hypothetical protein
LCVCEETKIEKSVIIKKAIPDQCFMPVILAIQEAEISRIVVHREKLAQAHSL